MNGRVYDPALGRFISPDPWIQEPYNTQSFNRYSYVWNNPLRYTDPSGEELATLTTPEQRGYGASDAGLSASASFYSSGNSTATAGSSKQTSSVLENTKAFVSDVKRCMDGGCYTSVLEGRQSTKGEQVGSLVSKHGWDAPSLIPVVGGVWDYGRAMKNMDGAGALMAVGTIALDLFTGGSAGTALRAEKLAAKALTVEALGAKEEITVYRAFGGDARAGGYSWTTKDPRTISNFRDAAGLPSGGSSGATNTADFLITGRTNSADVIKTRSALPLDGNKGGLPELIIDPRSVKITEFSVLKP
jgi:hypothetical protein